jgi:ribosome-binding factor A
MKVKRASRIGDQVLREIADLLMRKVKDPRVQGTTLTGIWMSDDLKHARVYYSVLGDEHEILETQAGLDSAKGYIKREIGLRLELKYMPEIVFKHDPTLAKGEQMEKLFQQIRKDDSSDSG